MQATRDDLYESMTYIGVIAGDIGGACESRRSGPLALWHTIRHLKPVRPTGGWFRLVRPAPDFGRHFVRATAGPFRTAPAASCRAMFLNGPRAAGRRLG
jgi:hypothetical protein